MARLRDRIIRGSYSAAQLAWRPFPSGQYRDENGTLRLTVLAMDWNGYVRLAFEEIRQAGAGSPQVSRRIKAALEDLKTVAPPDRQQVLNEELDLLEASTAVAVSLEKDAEFALGSDRLGMGREPDCGDGRSRQRAAGIMPRTLSRTIPKDRPIPLCAEGYGPLERGSLAIESYVADASGHLQPPMHTRILFDRILRVVGNMTDHSNGSLNRPQRRSEVTDVEKPRPRRGRSLL
jgi:hypothetical protein